jgi:hypothetical protein
MLLNPYILLEIELSLVKLKKWHNINQEMDFIDDTETLFESFR